MEHLLFNGPANQREALVLLQLEQVDQVLVGDAKNYHAWQFRIWLVRLCLHRSSHHSDDALDAQNSVDVADVLLKELAMTEKLIRQDELNNSAWNYRLFVFDLCQKLNITLPHSMMDSEACFVEEMADRDRSNISVQRYSKAISRISH